MAHSAPLLPHRAPAPSQLLSALGQAVACLAVGVMVVALSRAVAPTASASTGPIAFTVSVLLTSVLMRAALRWWRGPAPRPPDHPDAAPSPAPTATTAPGRPC